VSGVLLSVKASPAVDGGKIDQSIGLNVLIKLDESGLMCLR